MINTSPWGKQNQEYTKNLEDALSGNSTAVVAVL